MDLMQLRTIQWLTIIGAMAGIVGLVVLWESPYRIPAILIIVAASAAFVFAEIQRDRLSVLFSGIRSFHKTYPVHQNVEVFKQTTKEFRYMGISFGSLLVEFRAWLETGKFANVDVKLLLADPEDSELLRSQAVFENNLKGTQLTATEEALIDASVAKTRDSIRLTRDTVSTLTGARSIEVRFHHERIRKWMEIVDGRLAVVGLLRRGETGLACGVIEVEERYRSWGLFDHYREEWESIWESSAPRPEGSGRQTGAAG